MQKKLWYEHLWLCCRYYNFNQLLEECKTRPTVVMIDKMNGMRAAELTASTMDKWTAHLLDFMDQLESHQVHCTVIVVASDRERIGGILRRRPLFVEVEFDYMAQ